MTTIYLFYLLNIWVGGSSGDTVMRIMMIVIMMTQVNGDGELSLLSLFLFRHSDYNV